MGKPVAGDIAVLPFPQTNLRQGKRRPALVVVDLPGDALILCQITSQAHRDSHALALDQAAGRLKAKKLDETLAKLRQLFS